MSEPANRSISQALNAALFTAMREDPTVFVLGEDIGVYGGVFGVTRGLRDEFGPERVIDTPIAEAGFVGLATGAALGGLRPVVEIMWGDFTFVAADQLINQAAKAAYFWDRPVPLTIRIQQATASGSGPQHSQSVEALLAHYPGFEVAAPANPQDAHDLLLLAIESDRPTIILENRRIYAKKGPVDPTGPRAPFGHAAVVRDGTDVTLVSYSGTLHEALAAADLLAAGGVEAEVIDLRTLVPLDVATVRRSALKTGAVLVAHEDHGFISVSSELLAQLSCGFSGEEAGRVRFGRVTAPQRPSPVRGDEWRQWWCANAEQIASSATDLIHGR
jgi:pyruvate/2-oxoglutarate/acetoin dehydrogenase E1 component